MFQDVRDGVLEDFQRELGWWRIAIGVLGWAAMLHFHRALIGVSPLP